MKPRILPLLPCLLAVAWSAGPCQGMQMIHTATLTRFEAGLLDMETAIAFNGTILIGDRTVMKRAEKIPMVNGTTYGCILCFKETLTAKVRVELELPKAPKTWGDENQLKDEGVKISADKRTYIRSYSIKGGEPVMAFWSVADGDPDGTYILRVYLGDSNKPFRMVNFKLEKP